MSQYDVPVLWSPDTRLHDPRHEVWVGVPTVGTETAARVDAILEALDGPGFRLVEVAPADSGRRSTPSTTRGSSSSSAPPPTAGPPGRTPTSSARTASSPTSSPPPR